MAKYIDFPNKLVKGAQYQEDANVVRQELERLLTTEKGDFIDNPEYGVSMRRFIYELMTDDTAVFIEMEIRSAIDRWMGGTVTINRLTVDSNVDIYSFVVTLEVYINEFDENIVLQVPYGEAV